MPTIITNTTYIYEEEIIFENEEQVRKTQYALTLATGVMTCGIIIGGLVELIILAINGRNARRENETMRLANIAVKKLEGSQIETGSLNDTLNP